jgi:hypothetical protein
MNADPTIADVVRAAWRWLLALKVRHVAIACATLAGVALAAWLATYAYYWTVTGPRATAWEACIADVLREDQRKRERNPENPLDQLLPTNPVVICAERGLRKP